jgi:hypothetical protein
MEEKEKIKGTLGALIVDKLDVLLPIPSAQNVSRM